MLVFPNRPRVDRILQESGASWRLLQHAYHAPLWGQGPWHAASTGGRRYAAVVQLPLAAGYDLVLLPLRLLGGDRQPANPLLPPRPPDLLDRGLLGVVGDAALTAGQRLGRPAGGGAPPALGLAGRLGAAVGGLIHRLCELLGNFTATLLGLFPAALLGIVWVLMQGGPLAHRLLLRAPSLPTLPLRGAAIAVYLLGPILVAAAAAAAESIRQRRLAPA